LEEGDRLGRAVVEAPNDPSLESDLVEKFLLGTLSSSGEDEFRRVSRSNMLDLRRAAGAAGRSSRGSSKPLMTSSKLTIEYWMTASY